MESICGDGKLDPGEECDDGNLFIWDGCSDTCKIEFPYTCPTPNDYCIMKAGYLCSVEQPGVCDKYGNGVLTPEIGEECDDGNLRDGDGCSARMKIEEDFHCDGGSPTTCD